MAAVDVTMSKALVALLDDAKPFSNEATVTYAHDVDLKLDEVSAPVVYVDGTLAHQRQSRTYWTKSVTLNVLAVAPQQAAGASGVEAVEDEKDAWLAFIDDELIEAIKNAKVSDKSPTAINFTERMDPVRLRELSVFYTRFQITYPIV